MNAQSLSAKDMLQWVVCPVCHQSLQREDNIISCKGCGRRYPISAGIPLLLADRAL